MKLRSAIASTFGVALLAQTAAPAGAVSFTENFNTGFANGSATSNVPGFSVTSGNVDVIGPGFADFYPGNGFYVDLNGSTPGTIQTSTFNFLAGETYTLSFDVGANPDGGPAAYDFNVSIGSLLSQVVTGNTGSSFTPFSTTFTVGSDTSAALAFQSLSNGSYGAVIDNISLQATAVPEPAEYIGTLVFAGGAIALRRKYAGKKAK